MPQHSSIRPPRPVPPPFGIDGGHIEPRSPGRLRRLLAWAVIGLPLLAAMLGFLGGTGPSVTDVREPALRLRVETPHILRSGNWFETLVIVEPAADVADLTIAIDRSLWRAMSIDTVAPDAEKAESKGGVYSYAFGPVKAGERFVLKLDGQIQPRGFRRLSGRITARDGERPLAGLPLAVTVLP